MLILVLIISVLYLIHKLYQEKYTFWAKLGVQHIKPTLPLGNLDNFILKKFRPLGIQLVEFYNHFKSKNQRFFGYYLLHTPVFVPIDIDLIKNILTRDFIHFTQKPLYVNEKQQPISANLFFVGGEKWKKIRGKISPAFTPGKMKLMLPILLECCNPLLEHLENCSKSKFPVDVLSVSAKVTIDIIGSTSFGINCNCFKNPDAEFYVYCKSVFEGSYLDILKGFFVSNFQRTAKQLDMVPLPKRFCEFVTKVVRDAVKYRKDNNITKNDFLQLLIKLYDDKQISLEEVAAQSALIFIAGFETSSTTMAFCLLELAQNQNIQDRIRNEIGQVLAKYNGQITYEALGELKYMKQSIDETLRKHPPGPSIERVCSKEYKIEEENIIIPVGTVVVISTFGIHHDAEYYPNPEKFDPDRFSEINVVKRKAGTYLPFGEGPRLCIGQQFAMMQLKLGLLTFLRDYRYTLNRKTSPIIDYANKFVLAPLGDILLDVEKA